MNFKWKSHGKLYVPMEVSYDDLNISFDVDIPTEEFCCVDEKNKLTYVYRQSFRKYLELHPNEELQVHNVNTTTTFKYLCDELNFKNSELYKSEGFCSYTIFVQDDIKHDFLFDAYWNDISKDVLIYKLKTWVQKNIINDKYIER